MGTLPSDLTARIMQLEGRLAESSVKAEFTMLIGELVLSIKTLELELKAERTKSEAMRHNLRALATATSLSTPRGQDSSKPLSSTYKNANQVTKPRFLDAGSDLNIKYKTYRGLAPNLQDTSDPAVTKRLAFAEQRSRSNTSVLTAITENSSIQPLTAAQRASPPPATKTTHVSIKPKTRINYIFEEPSPRASVSAELDPIDLFNLDDIHIDTPFVSAYVSQEPTDVPPVKAPSTTASRDPSPENPKPASSSDSGVQSPSESPSPAEKATNEDIVPDKKVDNADTESPRTENTENVAPPKNPLSLPLDIPAVKLQVENAITSPKSPSTPTESDAEGITTTFVLEMLQQATLEGTRQKIELERTRKQLIVHNMQASTSSPMTMSASSDGIRPESSSSSSLAESKPSSLKMRFSMKRLRQKPLNLSVSHPVGLKVGSYRAEQDEFERIFYLTKDFIDHPSAAQRSEEAKLPELLRRRIGVLKESLDYDVDFSRCDIYAIPPFVLDTVCKTTRFNLSENKISEIPNQIRKFDKLEDWNAANNLLVRVPGAIGHLKSLRTLNFNNNKISEIPMEIAYLPVLEFLDFSENQIAEVPKAIGGLHSLKHFNISKNPITTLPVEIGLCSKLTHLEASTCFLRKLPKELACLVELEVLDLTSNNLKELPPGIGLLVKLRQLHVSNNQLTDLPISLGLCAQLVSTGKFDHSPNPWNPKLFGTVISGETTMVDLLLQRVLANQKSLSKLSALQPPKPPNVPSFKPVAVDTERWTMQEKIVCLGDWVTHTTDVYMKPALRGLYDLLRAATEVESPQLIKVMQIMRQVKILVFRLEDILKPPPFATDREFEDEEPLHQIRNILTTEIMGLDTTLRSLLPIIRSAAIGEKIADAVKVVNIVHFIRDLLFLLVLDEARNITTPRSPHTSSTPSLPSLPPTTPTVTSQPSQPEEPPATLPVEEEPVKEEPGKQEEPVPAAADPSSSSSGPDSSE